MEWMDARPLKKKKELARERQQKELLWPEEKDAIGTRPAETSRKQRCGGLCVHL